MKTNAIAGSAILALALTLSGPAWAQDIDFGDDSSTWANDGECDDPRFEGEASATVTSPVDQGRDATDCETAYDAGTVSLIGTGAAQSAPAMADGDIDFGDDSGTWANDGECDDPRFGGALGSHELADATDCRTAYEAGDVTFDEGDANAMTTEPVGDIDFGDDSGNWANDGECDDPRFGGMLDSHEMADATDCQTAYEAGEVTFDEGDANAMTTEPVGDIDFGDDSGDWANDGECDDPRFEGDGMGVGMDSHEMADATDCRTAYDQGTITYGVDGAPEGGTTTIDGIDFGDDSGSWANDGECDDPRFEGGGVGVALDDHLMADATDCAAAYRDGTITLITDDGDDGGVRINFGDDSGEYSNDAECDDPRFDGAGMGVALDSHLMADATDCQTAFDAGTISLAGEDGGDVRINFGDDSSAMAFDGVCDDPRFQGRGGAPELFAENEMADATDCQAAHADGTVFYDPQ